MKKIIKTITDDKMLLITLFTTLITSLFHKVDLRAINLNVILILFGLMLIVKNLENYGYLSIFANKLVKLANTSRHVVTFVTFISFFASMLLTNDVAIITLLPIYLGICKQYLNIKEILLGSICVIIAANLGSSFFTFGNPQNLFLFTYYHLNVPTFLSLSLPIALISIVLLSLLLLFVPKREITNINTKHEKINKIHFSTLSILMLIMILVIFKIVPLLFAIIIVTVSILILNKKSLLQIDYKILLIFVFFFITIDNLSHIQIIEHTLKTQFHNKISTMINSSLLSQFISNVPASILIAPYTNNVKALLWGVNIGGLGTLVASLANLLGYNIFLNYYPNLKKKFMIWFTIINVLLYLIIISILIVML